jgi:hypothetical protein
MRLKTIYSSVIAVAISLFGFSSSNNSILTELSLNNINISGNISGWDPASNGEFKITTGSSNINSGSYAGHCDSPDTWTGQSISISAGQSISITLYGKTKVLQVGQDLELIG